MCIHGSYTKQVVLPKSKAIVAYRKWVLSTDWASDLKLRLVPMHYYGRPNTWKSRHARSDVKPPKKWESDKGLHALTVRDNDPAPRSNTIAGKVLLHGRVIVHRGAPIGCNGSRVIGYRAEKATIEELYIDPCHSNTAAIRKLAERLRVKVRVRNL